MKKPLHGSSLYYATDKNIFDALNQHKVDTPTVMKLFQRRNIIVGKKTPREELAKYFSRLTHDYYDHKDIASRLGVVPRRERTTSMSLIGVENQDDISAAAELLKHELEASGDVVQLSRDGENLTINIHYTTVDYKLNEFSQVQSRDGVIQFIKSSGDSYTVRNTQNEYLNGVTETVLGKIEKTSGNTLTKSVISLFDIPSAKLRSKFFYDLINDLPGFMRRDVTDVYVFKAKPEISEDEGETPNESDPDTHIERVFLRGNGVTRSDILNGLLDVEDYYIVKIGWTARENTGAGNVYDIEAAFANYNDCLGFSYILSGVFPFEDGKLSSRKRSPSKAEVDLISRVIDGRSREISDAIHQKFSEENPGDAAC